MKLRDLIKILDAKEYIINDGKNVSYVWLDDGDTFEPFLDRTVYRVKAADDCFDIYLTQPIKKK